MKFTVRLCVENPNCLYADVEVEAKSRAQARDKAMELDPEALNWEVSDGNCIDYGDRYINTEDVEQVIDG